MAAEQGTHSGCAESTGLAEDTVWYGEYGEGEQTLGGG